MNSGQHKGLEYHGSLPFSVSSIAEFPQDGELMTINQGNEQVLRGVMMLEEKADHDDDDPVMLELKRQDQKINLVLELLSNIMTQFKAIPERRTLQLTHQGLSYSAEESSVANGAATREGESIAITGLCEIFLYIEPGMPRPLHLFGTASHDQSSNEVFIDFEGLTQGVIDSLDKYIFRFHRRLVASVKSVRS